MSGVPAAWTLRFGSGVRRRERGRVLVGGAPLGLLRLSEAGAGAVDRLARGEPIGTTPGVQSLARRLLDRGMASPVPSPGSGPPVDELVVVIPVRDDRLGLERTLRSLPTHVPVVVVDDGSPDPVRVELAGVTVLRREASHGPAAARNDGRALVDREMPDRSIVAFVDAGVVLEPDTAAGLLSHFDDPAIVAAAPRIRSSPVDGSARCRYELDASPLDLGPLPSRVAIGAAVPYVPTACLFVRLDALRQAGGFDERLRYGEDVDLVWRLASIGTVRYDPAVVAWHEPRPDLVGLVRQRIGYGSAAAPLAQRHGPAVAPLRGSPWTLAVLALLVSGHPATAVALHAFTARKLARRLDGLDDAEIEAARFTTFGLLGAGRAAARATVRPWWPLTAIAVVLPVSRRAAVRSLVAYAVDRAVASPSRAWWVVPLTLVDDVSYGAGVWWGSIRARSARALLPDVVTQKVSGRRSSGRFTMRSRS